MHLLPQGAATCCRLRLSWSGPSWPKLGLFIQRRIWTIFFHYRFPAHPEPSSRFLCSTSQSIPLFSCLRKIQRLKKYFLLISCSLQRFYFVLKKDKGTKKFFGGIPHLRSYRLTSVLRVLKKLHISFFPEIWLCVSWLLFLSFLSQT